MRATWFRLAATALAVAAGLVTVPGVTSVPASAATCSGVYVVVDYNELGSGVATRCLPDGGGDLASELFPEAGHPLTYAQRQPGFVCRVDGVPESDPCQNTSPADAYWGLFWSDGGPWTYSSQGATSLRVPKGGSVAFVWQNGGDRDMPSASPATQPQPSPSQSPSPTSNPQPAATKAAAPGATASADGTTAPSEDAAAPGDKASGSARASAAASGKPARQERTRTSTPSARESATSTPTEATESGTPYLDPQADDAEPAASASVPPWLVGLVVVALLVAAAAIAVVRRRSSATSG